MNTTNLIHDQDCCSYNNKYRAHGHAQIWAYHLWSCTTGYGGEHRMNYGQNQRMVSAELPIDYYTFHYTFSSRTVRDKALLALKTNQKTRCLLQTYIRFHFQLLERVRVALKSDYDTISTRSPAGI